MIPTWVMVAALAAGTYDPNPVPDAPEVFKVPGPYFKIPCNLNKLNTPMEAKEVARIQLYVSNNRGKSWEMYDEITPDTHAFTFGAKRPGEYWFTARLKMKDGTLNPADPAEFAPMQRVAVETGTGSETPVKAKPTAAEAANDLEDELTRVELELIRKEVKRLSEMSELTPAAEDKIDRLRIRLRDLRNQLSRDSVPSTNSPAERGRLTTPLIGDSRDRVPSVNPPSTSRAPSLLPQVIPSRADDPLIPATNLPVAPLPRVPGRP